MYHLKVVSQKLFAARRFPHIQLLIAGDDLAKHHYISGEKRREASQSGTKMFIPSNSKWYAQASQWSWEKSQDLRTAGPPSSSF